MAGEVEGAAARILRAQGATPERIRQKVIAVLAWAGDGAERLVEGAERFLRD